MSREVLISLLSKGQNGQQILEILDALISGNDVDSVSESVSELNVELAWTSDVFTLTFPSSFYWFWRLHYLEASIQICSKVWLVWWVCRGICCLLLWKQGLRSRSIRVGRVLILEYNGGAQLLPLCYSFGAFVNHSIPMLMCRVYAGIASL